MRLAKSCLCQHLETAANNAGERGSKASQKTYKNKSMSYSKWLEKQKCTGEFRQLAEEYSSGEYTHHVRGKPFTVQTTTESLAHSNIPSRTAYLLTMVNYMLMMRENAPGHFLHAGVFPFKRTDELSARMLLVKVVLSVPRRFHYLSRPRLC